MRLIMLGLLLWLTDQHVTAAQSVRATVHGIPSTATRLVGLLDGGGIISPTVFAKNVSLGTTTTVIDIATAAGGPYRLRMLAQSSDASLLSSGKVIGISVSVGLTVNVSLTLASVTVSVNGSTPTSATAGGQATLLFDIADSGEVVKTVASSCWADWSTNAPSLNNRMFGDLFKVSDSNYRCGIILSTPGNAALIHYRFGTYAYEFTYGGVTPILLAPSGTPRTMALVVAATINLNVSSIPPAATRILVNVEGGSLTAASISAQTVNAGTPAVSIPLGVPPGGPYRVRVATHDSSSQLLRTGSASGISVNASSSVTSNVAVTDWSAEQASSTPSVAILGSALTIAVNLVDAGMVLRPGDAQCWIDYGTAAETLTNRRYGAIRQIGGSQFRCSVSLTAPTSGSALYYRMSAYSLDLQYERITPMLSWPATVQSIPLASAGSISLSISNIPASDTRLVAAVDGGELVAPSLTVLNVAPGVGSASATINVAAGGPYRVRVVSHAAGGQVSRSGKASPITVSGGGSAAASVALSSLAIALDAATPSVAAPGTNVMLLFNLADAGDALELGSGACWANHGESASSLSNRGFGLMRAMGASIYQCAIGIPTPANSPVLYYQMQTALIDFIVDGVVPTVAWPSMGPLQLPVQDSITITTDPIGLRFTADGTAYTSPHTFSWVPGSIHIVAAADQDVGNTYYSFHRWSNGGAASHAFTAPSTALTLTAYFNSMAGDLHLEGISINAGSSLYQATYTITAENSFLAGGSASVSFQAGVSIRLGDGFQATAGSAETTFRASIGP